MYNDDNEIDETETQQETHPATLIELTVISRPFTYLIENGLIDGATDLFCKTATGAVIKLRLDSDDLVKPLNAGDKIMAVIVAHSPACDSYAGAAIEAIEMFQIGEDGRVHSLYQSCPIRSSVWIGDEEA